MTVVGCEAVSAYGFRTMASLFKLGTGVHAGGQAGCLSDVASLTRALSCGD